MDAAGTLNDPADVGSKYRPLLSYHWDAADKNWSAVAFACPLAPGGELPNATPVPEGTAQPSLHGEKEVGIFAAGRTSRVGSGHVQRAV